MKIKFLVSLILLAFLPGPLNAFPTWEKPAQPPLANELTALAVNPLDPSKIMTASGRDIYEAREGNLWRRLWQIEGSRRKIQQLLFFRELPIVLFVLTSDGAFAGNLEKNEWREIYRGKESGGKSALSFLILPQDPEHWFLGTDDGLYESDDAGKTWFRFSGFSKEPVPVLNFNGERLFIGTAGRLYASENLTDFRIVFSLTSGSTREGKLPEELLEEDLEEEISAISQIHALAVSENDGRMWLGTEKGVFESLDRGNHWQPFASAGLKNNSIRYVAFAEKAGKLFAGTSSGIYNYKPETKSWEEIFQGLAHPKPLGLTVVPGEKESLIAVTEEGFVRLALSGVETSNSLWLPSPARIDLFQQLIRLEPSARQMQKQTIRYGNLRNGKINRWQSESRLRALLPTFSFGKDFSRSNNIDIDRGGTSDADRFIGGPEETDRNWSMDFRWDLGDFIWSSNQTSIDSREKLMVELRNDMLSELTRIYYERRRLQMETVYAPAPSEQEHMERLMRIEELTALLDSLTNGFLSKRLEEVYERHRELERLWEYEKKSGSSLVTRGSNDSKGL